MENNKEKLTEVKTWLNDNSEKSDQEIKDFLLNEMGNDDFKESWTKHYFLEELKSPANGFSERILKIIKNVQKEINGNKPNIWRYFLASFIFYVTFKLIAMISSYIIGFIVLVLAVLLTKNKEILGVMPSLSVFIGMILGVWGGYKSFRYTLNYKRSIDK